MFGKKKKEQVGEAAEERTEEQEEEEERERQRIDARIQKLVTLSPTELKRRLETEQFSLKELKALRVALTDSNNTLWKHAQMERVVADNNDLDRIEERREVVREEFRKRERQQGGDSIAA